MLRLLKILAALIVSTGSFSARSLSDDSPARQLLTNIFSQICLATDLDRDRIFSEWKVGGWTDDPLNETIGVSPKTGRPVVTYNSNFSKDGIHFTVSGSRPINSQSFEYCAVNGYVSELSSALDYIETKLMLRDRYTEHEIRYLGLGLEPHVQKTIGWRLLGVRPVRIKADMEHRLAHPFGDIMLSISSPPAGW